MPEKSGYQKRAEKLAMFFKRSRNALYAVSERHITAGDNVLDPMWIESQAVFKGSSRKNSESMPMCVCNEDYPDIEMLQIPPVFSDKKTGFRIGEVFSTDGDDYLSNYYYPKDSIKKLQSIETEAYRWAGDNLVQNLTSLYVEQFHGSKNYPIPDEILELNRLRFSGELAIYYAQYWLDKEDHLERHTKRSAVTTKSGSGKDKQLKQIESGRRIQIVTKGERTRVSNAIKGLLERLDDSGVRMVDSANHHLLLELLDAFSNEMNPGELAADPKAPSKNTVENIFVRRLYRLLNSMHGWEAKANTSKVKPESECTTIIRLALRILDENFSTNNDLINSVVETSDKVKYKNSNPIYFVLKTKL